MGIFGALTTAVAGMRAQSYALENISGNIANSQTTAFKRIDTSFQDLIPDTAANKQLAGSVTASSRPTNNVQGDIQNSSIGTSMAINGEGFFVVQKPANFVDNNPVFEGVDLYTRRGDFQVDKNGYLVNGAGYFLMGVPVDATTGNLVGSVPTLLQFKNDFLPAQQTTQIDYRTNLASTPNTREYDSSVPGSELLKPSSYSANPIAGAPAPARIIGAGATLKPDAPALFNSAVDISGLSSTGGTIVINGTNVAIPAGANAAAVQTAINAQTATTGVAASLNAANKLVLTSDGADTSITIGGSSTLSVLNELGLQVGLTNGTNLITQSAVAAGQTLTVKVGGNPTTTITFGNGAGQVSTMAELATALGGLSGGLASLNTANGNLTIGAASITDTITVDGSTAFSNFGIQITSALPSNGTVVGNDVNAFLDQSIGGGAITAYDISGSPTNIQIRWAKTDSASTGGVDTWNMFYQVSSTATGSQVAWQNVGVDYKFKPNGQMDPAVNNVTLNSVVINGVDLGTLQLSHGSGGITQFADANGAAQVGRLQQNGYAAGTLQSVGVNDKGRVVGSYSNGRTLDLAEITLANFNGANFLKREDGGAFSVTDGSGSPVYDAPGSVVASALEGSNTDIADEFTKLIVTQQAYSANTKVITTSNDMVQSLLNMLR